MTLPLQLPVLDFSQIGPNVGSRFPDIRLPDQAGRLMDLRAARGQRRALVVIYRSARW
jgi:peroxiredoxin